MKRIELLLSAILLPVDYAMILLAGLAAYALRFGGTVSDLRPVFYELPLPTYLSFLLFAAGVFVVVFALSGLYTIRSTKRFIDEFASIFLSCSTGVMAVIILFFFQRELFSSRFIILTGWVLAIVCVTIGRLLVRSVQRALLRRGIGLYRIALFGEDQNTARLAAVIREQPALGYYVVERFPAVTDEALAVIQRRLEEYSIETFGGIIQSRGVDILLQADPGLHRDQTSRLVEFANYHHITFKYAADISALRGLNVALEHVGEVPVFELKRTRLEGWGRILKRVFDIVLASALLFLLSPIFLLAVLMIRADSDGPVLVRLQRVGERGRPFKLFKFRSMIQNAHALKQKLMQHNERGDGPLFKMKNDPRITRVGRWIRKTSIDELPQLWNVLRGEMSLVGPRPHEPEEVSRYTQQQRALLTIKPGITGMAQVSGRSALAFHEEARLDISYIEQWSLWLDIAILVRTPIVVVRMKSVA